MPIELGSFSLGSVAGTIVGAIVGNFFAIGRDWRKEFNESADEIFIKLSDERRYIGRWKGVSKIEFAVFRRKILPWKRKSFDKCEDTYHKARREKNRQDSNGIPHQCTPEIREAIDNLQKFTNRR